MKYTDLQKKNFLAWHIDATPEDIALAKETNEALYNDLRNEYAAEVIRIDGFKIGFWRRTLRRGFFHNPKL